MEGDIIISADGPSIASSSYVKLNTVAYHWPKTVQSQPSYPQQQSDAAALREYCDTRIWLPSMKKVSKVAFDAEKSLFYRRREAAAPCMELHVAHMDDTRMTLLFRLEDVQLFAQEMKRKGHTSQVLSPPSALTLEEMKNIEHIETCLVKTLEDLGDLQKKVDKQNKKVTHEENMSRWAQEYEEIRRVWRDEPQATFIGIDCETWETQHDELLELGFSVAGPQRDQETFHYVISDAFHNGLRNGRYVPDNRKLFLFGTNRDKPLVGKWPPWPKNGTEIATCTAAGLHFTSLIKERHKSGPVYIVFHDSKGDMKVMNQFGIDTKEWSYALVAAKVASAKSKGDITETAIVVDKDSPTDSHPIYVLDTQQMFAAIRCGGTGQMRSLKNICIALDVNDGVLSGFHNAANDAHYTAAALVKMASGPHSTLMRGIAETNLASEEAKKGIDKSSKVKKPKKSTWD